MSASRSATKTAKNIASKVPTKTTPELKLPDSSDGYDEIVIDIVGNVDSGKSTLVGVLTKGITDDGRGYARTKVFNFSHEASNGRTSSIG